MRDEELLFYSLKRIAATIERIINNSKEIDDSEYYLLSPVGMERLESSTCMLILAIVESIKGIDKMTHKQLLAKYPEIDWKGVMGIRDIIAHHYFDIDEAIVFDVVKNKLPGLLEAINKMIRGL